MPTNPLVTIPRLRFVFWMIALVLGGSEAWALRHETLSDGVPYLEIATHYAAGDWWNALNAYWSPFFSWAIALALVVIHPSVYWQIATMRLVMFLAYLASMVAFEWLLSELHDLIYRWSADREEGEGAHPLPYVAFYASAWCCFIFAALACVGFFFPTPDMLGLLFVILLAALLLRINRTGGSTLDSVALGVLCAASFLNRAAFAPIVLVALSVAAISVWRRRRKVAGPLPVAAAVAGVLALPFVVALSLKEHRPTFSDSGKLNYSWEVNQAHRWVHWQGEPGNIGRPLHPTQLISPKPKTFLFDGPVESSYPPWYDPAYWYAGVAPRFSFGRQLQVMASNTGAFLRLLLRSPVMLPVLPFIFVFGWRRWIRGMLRLWPILLPSLITAALFTVVYIEKRYVAGNLLILWLASVGALRGTKERVRDLAAAAVVTTAAVLVTGAYAASRPDRAVSKTMSELLARTERSRNVHYLLAKGLREDGLCPGAKVAYIGPGMNVEWAREGGYRIVAEIPLMYSRVQTLVSNFHVEDLTQIHSFFALSEKQRQQLLEMLRSHGIQMLVTDGFFEQGLIDNWPKVLPATEDRVPTFNKNAYSQINSRYQWIQQPPPHTCPAMP